MWELIKSDLKYCRVTVIVGFSGIILFSLIAGFAGDYEDEKFVYAGLGLIVWMVMFARWGHYLFYNENLERFHAQLPVSQKNIGLARLISFYLIWLTMLSLFLTIYLLFDMQRNNNFSIWSIIVVNGLVLMINSAPFLWHDFQFFSKAKQRKLYAYLFYIPLILLLMGIVYLTTSIMYPSLQEAQNTFQYFLFRPIPALATNIFGILLYILSYWLYVHKASYLHSEFGLKLKLRLK
ncbi:hypothetical protein ACFLS9_05615 [Bacteroidota bacterium]